MPDEKDERMERFLKDPPEEIFAMFQHQLRHPISEIGAWVEILIDPDSSEEREEAIAGLYKQLEVVQNELDFALDYLSKYHEHKKKTQ
jgi:hypothetical protein